MHFGFERSALSSIAVSGGGGCLCFVEIVPKSKEYKPSLSREEVGGG